MTAEARAGTAVSFQVSTERLPASTRAGQVGSPVRHIPIPGHIYLGGIPIDAAGSIVDGVGMPGAPGGAKDDACARVGIAAVEDRLQT